LDKSFKRFLPRVIVNYQISPAAMVYASVAKGANPGDFNAGVLGYGDALQKAAVAAGVGIVVEPETVVNYEVGMKGRALDQRLTYSLSGFYSQWRNQINAITVIVNDTTSATGVSIISGAANSGSVDLYGIELETALRVSDLITFNAAGAVNLSDIKSFVSPTITALSGITDYSGKEQPNNSKYSATAGIQFGGDVHGADNTKWFLRGDWVYKSGVWSNQANTVRTSDAHKFNFRTGFSQGNSSVELFLKNAFNNKAYTSIADNWTFDPSFRHLGTYSALVVGLPELRTAGVQAKLKF
jgi:iron complex outermembrane receptor protein